jgi:hypothetical protein
MAEIASYTPEEVNVLLAGFIPIKGFADGTFISITKDVMPFSSRRTADGTVSRAYHNDQTYTLALTLHSASEFNDIMTKLWQLDEISQVGKFPILIKDNSGTDLFFSTTTWIETIPEIVKSTAIDNRTWIMRSSQAVINIGGNAEPSSLIDDIVNLAASALPIVEGIL